MRISRRACRCPSANLSASFGNSKLWRPLPLQVFQMAGEGVRRWLSVRARAPYCARLPHAGGGAVDVNDQAVRIGQQEHGIIRHAIHFQHHSHYARLILRHANGLQKPATVQIDRLVQQCRAQFRAFDIEINAVRAGDACGLVFHLRSRRRSRCVCRCPHSTCGFAKPARPDLSVSDASSEDPGLVSDAGGVFSAATFFVVARSVRSRAAVAEGCAADLAAAISAEVLSRAARTSAAWEERACCPRNCS